MCLSPGAAHLSVLGGYSPCSWNPPQTSNQARAEVPQARPAHRPTISMLSPCQILATLQASSNTTRWCLTEGENAPRKTWAQDSGERPDRQKAP
jgi:hypothetical protein